MLRRAASDLGRRSRRRGRPARRRRRKPSCSTYCRERLADYKRPKQIHITDAIPRTATGKIQRGVVAKALPSAGVVRIVIAGAGAIGGYIGARLAQAGADVVLFARGPHLQAMQERGPARRSARTAISRCRPQVTGDLSDDRPGRRGLPRREGARPDARSRRSCGRCSVRDTAVVSTQNGIPWWYFQDHGGELEGLRLERVDPGGVDRGSDRAAARRRIARVFRHRHRRARRDSAHRRQPDQLRRAGRIEVGARARRSPKPLIAAGLRCPINRAVPPRDLGEAARQRRVQPDQRADRGDPRGAGAPSATSRSSFAR